MCMFDPYRKDDISSEPPELKLGFDPETFDLFLEGKSGRVIVGTLRGHARGERADKNYRDLGTIVAARYNAHTRLVTTLHAEAEQHPWNKEAIELLREVAVSGANPCMVEKFKPRIPGLDGAQ